MQGKAVLGLLIVGAAVLLMSAMTAPAFAQSTSISSTSSAPAADSASVVTTQTEISSLTSQRAGMILSADPEGSRVMSRLSAASLFGEDDSLSVAGSSTSSPPMSFSETGQNQNGDFAFSTSLSRLGRVSVPSGFDIWTAANADLTGSRTVGGQNDGAFLTADLGVDYITTPSLLFGSLVEVDSLAQASSAFPTGLQTAGNGQAWMAGPYMGVHLLPHLFIDARMAVGDSGDHADPMAHYQDGFSTMNALSEIKISGGWTFGDLHFDPSSRATFYEGRQNSFIDSSADFIPAQRLVMAETAFGPKISYDFSGYPGLLIEPAIAVNALWNFQRDASMIDPTGQASLHAETEFSTEIKTIAGLSLKCSIDYDGIGAQQTHDLKGLMAINLPLAE